MTPSMRDLTSVAYVIAILAALLFAWAMLAIVYYASCINGCSPWSVRLFGLLLASPGTIPLLLTVLGAKRWFRDQPSGYILPIMTQVSGAAIAFVGVYALALEGKEVVYTVLLILIGVAIIVPAVTTKWDG